MLIAYDCCNADLCSGVSIKRDVGSADMVILLVSCTDTLEEDVLQPCTHESCHACCLVRVMWCTIGIDDYVLELLFWVQQSWKCVW